MSMAECHLPKNDFSRMANALLLMPLQTEYIYYCINYRRGRSCSVCELMNQRERAICLLYEKLDVIFISGITYIKTLNSRVMSSLTERTTTRCSGRSQVKYRRTAFEKPVTRLSIDDNKKRHRRHKHSKINKQNNTHGTNMKNYAYGMSIRKVGQACANI